MIFCLISIDYVDCYSLSNKNIPFFFINFESLESVPLLILQVPFPFQNYPRKESNKIKKPLPVGFEKSGISNPLTYQTLLVRDYRLISTDSRYPISREQDIFPTRTPLSLSLVPSEIPFPGNS